VWQSGADAIVSANWLPLVERPAGSLKGASGGSLCLPPQCQECAYIVKAPLLIQDIHSLTRQVSGCGVRSALPELDGAPIQFPGGLVGEDTYI